MPGIGKELAVFLHAGLTGVLVVSVYLCLRVLRRLVKHALWMINIEDAVFWVSTSIYMFVQIYHTSSGLVRWYFILGVAFGLAFVKILVTIATKIYKKMCDFAQRK